MTPSLSSGLLRALPVVLHHPGLPQLHLAFYCTKCCSRLNIIISLFGWGKGRSPLHTDLEDGLPHKPLPNLGCAMRMKLVWWPSQKWGAANLRYQGNEKQHKIARQEVVAEEAEALSLSSPVCCTGRSSPSGTVGRAVRKEGTLLRNTVVMSRSSSLLSQKSFFLWCWKAISHGDKLVGHFSSCTRI